MPENFKTPGVYIIEKDSGKSSIVQVATAVPIFIGFTERAELNGKSVHMKPVHITSLSDYEIFFGGPPQPIFTIKQESSSEDSVFLHGKTYSLIQNENTNFLLYRSLKLFFDNGGADSYIISIGQYGDNAGDIELTVDNFKKAITKLEEEEVPTMIVMPDSLLLEEEDGSYYSLLTAVLQHCGKHKNRIGIFDIWGGGKELPPQEDKNKYITRFRESIGLENLTYGAAYYPWLNTNIVPLANIGYKYFDLESLQSVIIEEHRIILKNLIGTDDQKEKKYWDSGLKNVSLEYKLLRKIIADKINLLPAAPAIAGLYTRTDKASGVWRAPANQNLNSVISLPIKITHEDQESLNVDGLSGKSINAIRAFKGRGIALVWGARTLAGNSEEWRYINVRRLFILIEQSIKNSAYSVVFQPNVPITWAVVKGSINSFLASLWRQGALVGGTPDEAFDVFCGIGETMTEEDVRNGIMRIQVKVAPSRPAEFVVITFEQKMGDSE